MSFIHVKRNENVTVNLKKSLDVLNFNRLYKSVNAQNRFSDAMVCHSFQNYQLI